ncbi:MAG: hypothetical protein DRN27_03655 [Thermoplasmata archaeon]|nr:MAG: hypothetical protein DRN27_03655 [Thermoplasmata archaeon]
MAEETVDQKRLVVSTSPHMHDKKNTEKIMYIVCLALLLPIIGGVYFFGIYTILVVLVSVITAIITEFLAKRLRKREFMMDGSTIVTGILFALVLPPRIPLWAVIIGAAFCIAIVKEAFGGLGYNIFNPALAGRAFITVSFASLMTSWIAPVTSIMSLDSITSATPLGEGFSYAGSTSDMYIELLFGNVGGCIGETSALLILLGGLLLIGTGVIKWRIPTIYIGTVFLLTWIIPGQDPVFHILAGGLFLGAFFMATDYVTCPMTAKGQYIFAFGAGLLVVLIRIYGSMPEGVAFSILLMNAFTPLIDRHIKPKPYGFIPPEKKSKFLLKKITKTADVADNSDQSDTNKKEEKK